MIIIVSLLVVAALAIGACLFVVARRGGSGEQGALERGAAEQGLAQGMSMGNAREQSAGGLGI
ncbi:hypothetical protein [Streptomyces sp. NPDC087300]|uniref:hypothetical protein n=1 Tax=Streptomyces sp. NPDC087300 TaxID=3365780 RepID=UPI0038299625